MSELRQNMATNEWVIIATDRAKRPDQFKRHERRECGEPKYSKTCPFCPGNEDKTPPEIARVPDGERGWLVRAVPNKFSAVSPGGTADRKNRGRHRYMHGIGAHEVIVETTIHNAPTMLLDVDHIAKVVDMQHGRFRALQSNPDHEQVILFKNHGCEAGTSLAHPHSQIVALPIVPAANIHRVRTALDYKNDSGHCVYCDMLAEELESGDRVITANEHFVAFVPFAAFSPFHTWVLPRKHRASFASAAPEERRSLAAIMKDVLARIYYGLEDPDFNYVYRSVPSGEFDVDYFHWYVSIVLRLTKAAGFEMGSGMFINVSLPEQDAEFLRKVKVPD